MHGDGGVDAVGVVGAEVVEMAWAARTYVAVEWVDEGTQLELWVEEVDQAAAHTAVNSQQRVGMDYNQAGREEPVAVLTAGVDDIAESAAVAVVVVVVVASASDYFGFRSHSWRIAHFAQQAVEVVGMQPTGVHTDQL